MDPRDTIEAEAAALAVRRQAYTPRHLAALEMEVEAMELRWTPPAPGSLGTASAWTEGDR